MLKSTTLAVFALAIASAVAFAATPAEAQERRHGRVVHGHGPYGGYVAGRHVVREPGSTQVTRGVLTHGGHGYRQTRSTSWGDGAVHNSVRRNYANGTSMVRDGSVVRNPDGSVSRHRSRTGPAGNSQSRWSTIYRTDDGYTRTGGAQTSNGRGYSASRDVSWGDGSLTVNRNATTNAGRTINRSRTYTRPR